MSQDGGQSAMQESPGAPGAPFSPRPYDSRLYPGGAAYTNSLSPGEAPGTPGGIRRLHVPMTGMEGTPVMHNHASMPCNLQERMTCQQNNAFQDLVPLSLEQTLENLPHDAIHFHHALPNHSGKNCTPNY